MKKSFFKASLLGLFIVALSMPTFANGNNYPPTTPPSADIDVNINPSAQANAAAVAAAKAQAAANSASTSTGIGVGTGGASDSSAAANGGGASYSDTSSSRMYVFPQPVWATVPQAAGCIVTSARSAGLGWNFVSAAKSVQFSDPVCVGVILARSAYANCHFLSESMIMARVYQTAFPGADALPVAPDLRNLSLAECEDLKKPKLVVAPMVAPPAPVAVVPVSPPVATQACPVVQKPVQRRVVKPKKAVLSCPVPLVPAK